MLSVQRLSARSQLLFGLATAHRSEDLQGPKITCDRTLFQLDLSGE